MRWSCPNRFFFFSRHKPPTRRRRGGTITPHAFPDYMRQPHRCPDSVAPTDVASVQKWAESSVSVLLLLNNAVTLCAKWPLLFSFSNLQPRASHWVAVSPWQRPRFNQCLQGHGPVYSSLTEKCHFVSCLQQENTTWPHRWSADCFWKAIDCVYLFELA